MKLFRFKQPAYAQLVLPAQQQQPQHLRSSQEHEEQFNKAVAAWTLFSTTMWTTIGILFLLMFYVLCYMVFAPSMQSVS